MNEAWQNNGSLDRPGIASIGALPQPEPIGTRKNSHRWWSAFWSWLRPRLEKSEQLAEAYGEAKVGQESVEVKRKLAEASEIQAKAEHERIRAEGDRQEVTKKFIENLRAIDQLPSDALQRIAFAKLMEHDLGLIEKSQELDEFLSHLHYKRGLSIQPLGFVLPIPATVGAEEAAKPPIAKAAAKKAGKARSKRKGKG
jgi:hypothetical protein